MEYYINGKNVPYNLVKKYRYFLIFCSTWEEHILKSKEKYVTERASTNEELEIIKEIENELLQLS